MIAEPFWPWDEGYDDEPDEPQRCEVDHRDGGVCLRRLRWDGSCPSEWDHSYPDVEVNP